MLLNHAKNKRKGVTFLSPATKEKQKVAREKLAYFLENELNFSLYIVPLLIKFTLKPALRKSVSSVSMFLISGPGHDFDLTRVFGACHSRVIACRGVWSWVSLRHPLA